MTEITTLPETVEENELLLHFKKPFRWEDKEYTEVDLSGLEELTAMDLERAYREYAQTAGLNLAAVPELSVQYACIIAAKVAKKPQEFFEALPAKYALELRNMVRNYFFGED